MANKISHNKIATNYLQDITLLFSLTKCTRNCSKIRYTLNQHQPILFSNVVIILQFIVGILFKTNSDFLLFLTSNVLACKSYTTLMVGIREVEEIKHLGCVSRHPCKFLGSLARIFCWSGRLFLHRNLQQYVLITLAARHWARLQLVNGCTHFSHDPCLSVFGRQHFQPSNCQAVITSEINADLKIKQPF